MIDWEEILKAEDLDELKQAKLWLFRENMRLENERNEFMRSKDKFLEDRKKLRDEIETLNRRTTLERKRLKQENLFFEKKMAILQAGFLQLDEDRKRFEQEKHKQLEEIARLREQCGNFDDGAENSGNVAEVLFRSITNPLALRKRYRDLVKIFHPDNLCGDEELAQQINKEFVRRKKEE